MAINPHTKMTPAEYLAFERAQTDAKHEYLHGEIAAMLGASLVHNIIVTNLVISLVLRTAIASPVWLGDSHCFSEHYDVQNW
jgi:Uma2 family endonuclease